MMNKKMNMTIGQKELFMAAMGKPAMLNGIATRLTSILRMPEELLRNYFSRCLERELDSHQTRLIIQAQVAFILAVLPTECPLLLRVAFCTWLVLALKACKQAL